MKYTEFVFILYRPSHKIGQSRGEICICIDYSSQITELLESYVIILYHYLFEHLNRNLIKRCY